MCTWAAELSDLTASRSNSSSSADLMRSACRTRNARIGGDKAAASSAAVDYAAAHLVEDEDVGALNLLAHEIHHLPSAVNVFARAKVWPVLQLVPLLELLQESGAVDHRDHGVQSGAHQGLWLRDERAAEVVAHLHAPKGWF